MFLSKWLQVSCTTHPYSCQYFLINYLDAAAGGDSFAEHTLVNGDNINADQNQDQNNPEEIVIAQNGNDQEAPEEAGMNVEDEFAVDNDIGAPDLPDVSHIFSNCNNWGKAVEVDTWH